MERAEVHGSVDSLLDLMQTSEELTSSDLFDVSEEDQNEITSKANEFPATNVPNGDTTWRPFKRIVSNFKTNAKDDSDISPNTLKMMPRPPQAGEEITAEKRKYEREYIQMVKKFEEKEKKKKDEAQRKCEAREKRMEECKKIWQESDIIENWEIRKAQKKTQELIFKGIPPRFRPIVWPLMLGNRLQITEELFEIYIAQAQRMREMSGKQLGKEESLKVIELDLPRTFPALSFFQPDGPLHPQLRKILEAYVSYRPDIGYVQGMSFLASMLLLVMDTYDAFQCLANLLNRPFFLGFFRMDIDHIDNFVDIFEQLLAGQLPKLHQYLMSYGISAHIYIMDWVLTLFAKSLPLDTASRLWDNIFYEGESFLIRTGLALLSLSESEILASSYDNAMLLLTHFPEYDEDDIFAAVNMINVKNKELEAILSSMISASLHL